MKKRIVSVIMLVIMVITMLSLTGCGNMSLGMGNYEFKKIHVDTYNNNFCLEIEKWYDSETGIEVDTKDFDGLCFSEGTYILIEDECPFCKEVE